VELSSQCLKEIYEDLKIFTSARNITLLFDFSDDKAFNSIFGGENEEEEEYSGYADEEEEQDEDDGNDLE